MIKSRASIVSPPVAPVTDIKLARDGLEIKSTLSKEDHKRDLFKKILKDEFLRELSHTSDVVHGRAEPRDTFVEKVVKQLKEVTAIIPSGLPVTPSQVVDTLGAVAVFAANRERDKRLSTLATLRDGLDLDRLNILLEVVAREALRRYESFIVDSLSDNNERGVILFARVGAQRMLEYLSRHAESKDGSARVTLSESTLLAGLVEGRSGAWVADFSNNVLELKKMDTRRLRKKHKTIDAETVYARPGFRVFQIKDGKKEDSLYIRRTARHAEIKGWEKVTEILKGQTESFYNFGYTKFRKSNPQDPKAGYVLMPLEVIMGRYDFVEQERDNISALLQAEVRSSSHSIIVINRGTVAKYLQKFLFLKNKESKYKDKDLEDKNLSLIEYVRDELHYPFIKMVVCREDLTDLRGADGSSLSLAGADFSHMDLSGAILGGDLTNTKFDYSYLEGAELKSVTSLRGASFRHAHCEYLHAEGVNFGGADLLQANFSYAVLNGARLTGGQNTLGAIWVGVDLKEVIYEDMDSLFSKQRSQLDDLEIRIQKQREDFENFRVTVETAIHQLRRQVNWNISRIQNLLVFKRYCQQEIQRIHEELGQKADESTVQNLQKQLTNLKKEFEEAEAEQKKLNEKILATLKPDVPSPVSPDPISQYLPKDYREVDVPDDNNCLFWSAALGLLLPVVHDEKSFALVYKQLFGYRSKIVLRNNTQEEKSIDIGVPATIEGVRYMLLTYDCRKNTPKQYEGDVLVVLVCEKFRERVVECLDKVFDTSEKQSNVAGEKDWESYTRDMCQITSWGGAPEIQAISYLAKVNIELTGEGYTQPQCWPVAGASKTLYLVHASASGKAGAIKNHYHFGLHKDIYNKFFRSALLENIGELRKSWLKLKAEFKRECEENIILQKRVNSEILAALEEYIPPPPPLPIPPLPVPYNLRLQLEKLLANLRQLKIGWLKLKEEHLPDMDEKEKQRLFPLQNELITACKRGNLEAVLKAIKKGARPNYPGSGEQPLGAAVWGMNPEIVKLLTSPDTPYRAIMSLEKIKKHNLDKYGDIFLVSKEFDPLTIQEWYNFLIKIESSLFLRNFHVKMYNEACGMSSSWETFKAQVYKDIHTISVNRTRADIVNTKKGMQNYRAQVTQSLEMGEKNSKPLDSEQEQPSELIDEINLEIEKIDQQIKSVEQELQALSKSSTSFIKTPNNQIPEEEGKSHTPKLDTTAWQKIREEEILRLAPFQDKLVRACEQGDLDKAQKAIFAGARPYYPNAQGKQPLGAAVRGMNPEVVNYLLAQTWLEPPMNWEACEQHNIKEYKQVYFYNQFNPATLADWCKELSRANNYPFLNNILLDGYHKGEGRKIYGSWEEFIEKINGVYAEDSRHADRPYVKSSEKALVPYRQAIEKTMRSFDGKKAFKDSVRDLIFNQKYQFEIKRSRAEVLKIRFIKPISEMTQAEQKQIEPNLDNLILNLKTTIAISLKIGIWQYDLKPDWNLPSPSLSISAKPELLNQIAKFLQEEFNVVSRFRGALIYSMTPETPKKDTQLETEAVICSMQ